jgi:hypothetical protein
MNRLLATTLAALCLSAAGSFASPNVDLARTRTSGTRNYEFTTDYRSYAADGSLSKTDTLCVAFGINRDDKGEQTLACARFAVSLAGQPAREIPALKGWRNTLDRNSSANTLGVPQNEFLGLAYGDGAPLSPDMGYLVYNTFVDAYAFNNVFAEHCASAGPGVGDLKADGQSIQHYSAFSKVPIDMGGAVKPGSHFTNGRVMLTLKGHAVINGRPCAIVGFDSGDSSLLMLMEPAPGMNMEIKGGSHYWGDIYIDEETLWVEQITFEELVLTQVNIAGNPQSTIIVRSGRLETVR